MRRLIVLAFALVVAAPLLAQTTGTVFPRFSVTAGGYMGDFGTDLRVDPGVEGFEGTQLDFERDLGLDDAKTLTRFTLEWRPFRRHTLSGSYFSSARSGSRAIDRQIVFDDVTFPIHIEVNTEIEIDFWEANYTYWARQSPTGGLGIGLGVSGLEIGAALNARLAQTTAQLSESVATQVPVPVIGLEGRKLFANRLVGMGRIALLPRVKVSDYEGDAMVAKASLEYQILDALAVGVRYNYFKIDGSLVDIDFRADLGMTVSGTEGYVRLMLGGH